MTNISLILAMDNNRAIGCNNQLLWHLPNDLKNFKKITMGKPVVMGRKTFESIGRPLPGRDNIILTRNKNTLSNSCGNSIKIYNNIDDILLDYNNIPEIMIIGGGEIYNLFLDRANKIYLTLVDTKLLADTFFPELDSSWQEQSNVSYESDEKHQYSYSFIELLKK